MESFAIWLHKYESTDPSLVALKETAIDFAHEWPYFSNSKSDYKDFVRKHVVADSRDKTLELLDDLFEKWQPRVQSRWTLLINNINKIGLFAAAVVVAGALALALSQEEFFAQISSAQGARALITLLFSFTTIAVALLVAFAVFWVPVEDLEVRFAKAKDLLTIVVGIFGTILGFYFGQAYVPPALIATQQEATINQTATEPGE